MIPHILQTGNEIAAFERLHLIRSSAVCLPRCIFLKVYSWAVLDHGDGQVYVWMPGFESRLCNLLNCTVSRLLTSLASVC